MTVDININDLDSFAINEGENLSLSFSLSYLHNICMYSKISKDIEIKLTRDYPMKITYLLGDENSKMTFYLAPKINDE
jgi:DNA polymerase III sliding clamp (beta) subunit (PCNA family)